MEIQTDLPISVFGDTDRRGTSQTNLNFMRFGYAVKYSGK